MDKPLIIELDMLSHHWIATLGATSYQRHFAFSAKTGVFRLITTLGTHILSIFYRAPP